MDRSKLNKVLNRPLFRDGALKKGALKPIKAQSGIMVGMPTGGPSVVNPNKLPIPAGPVINRTPSKFMRGIQNAVSGAMDYMDPTNIKMYKGIGNLGVDYVAGRGLYNIGQGLGLGDTTSTLGSVAGLFNPITRGAGVLSTLGEVGKYALGAKYDPKTDVMSTRFGDVPRFMGGVDTPGSPRQISGVIKSAKEQKKEAKRERDIANLLTAPDSTITRDYSGLSYGMEAGKTGFANLSKADQEKLIERNAYSLAQKTGISETKAANILSASYYGKVDPAQANRAVQDEAVYAQTIPNKYKDPNISLASTTEATPPEASEGSVQPKPKGPIKVDQPTKIGDAKTDKRKAQTENVDAGTSLLGQGVIGRAKEIYKELAAGRSSNANLVFLSNLASGLLKGTTNKSGVGGALEVLGAALGPATSNYAIMKLKEDEINNKLMGEALDASAAELKAYAAIAAAQAKGGKAESFGAIQAIGPKGQIVNYQGLRTPTGGLRVQNPDGTFTDVAIGADLGNGFKVAQYIDMKANKEAVDTTKRALLSRIKSAGYAKQSLDILAADPQKAGGVGAFSLLTSRVGSLLDDIGLGGYNSNVDAAKSRLKIQTEKMRSEADAALEDGTITEDQYKELEKVWKSADKNVDKVIQRYKGSASLKDKDREELEQLAVNEVTLTYALANSFKDKDRLTARDVQAAKEIVNIFSWTRGSASVRASLNAIKSNLEKDITGYVQELQREGVTQQTIDALLADYDVTAFERSTQKATEKFTPEALDNILGGIQL